MKSPLAIAMALLLTGAASAATIEKGERNADTGAPIVVQFGSYSSGIDEDTYAEVSAFVAKSDAIDRAVEAPWGDAGERDIGVFPKEGRTAEVAAAIKRIVPDVSTKGWIKLLDGKGQSAIKVPGPT